MHELLPGAPPEPARTREERPAHLPRLRLRQAGRDRHDTAAEVSLPEAAGGRRAVPGGI
ncbi:hypothetical protein SFR_1344 [Streptomyces sp. FR-008]|nr:hypothetical protein SFR_1344 [Streptomyces sp. FR-008]